MSMGDEVPRGDQVIWFYGWTKGDLTELLTPIVAVCHIHEGRQMQSNMAPKFYFRGSDYEIKLVRGHMLIERIHVKQVADRTWACNKDNWAQQHRPHIMMGKPTTIKMNVQGTVTGRFKSGKPGITEQEKN